MSDLEEALALRAVSAGEWIGIADARYVGGIGLFGGWTAALLLNAVMQDAHENGTPSSLTVHYLKALTPGSELRIRTRRVGGSRSLHFWNAELSAVGQEEIAATATVLVANRRPSDSFTEPEMPATSASDPLFTFQPPGTFGAHTPVKAIYGYPPFNQPSTRSLAWTRESSGRAVDFVQLAYLADASAPRIFYKGPTFRASPTVTMSVYFLATEAELREVGDDDVLIEAVGTRAEHSTAGSQARLWSRKGTLLATTEQLCWFR